MLRGLLEPDAGKLARPVLRRGEQQRCSLPIRRYEQDGGYPQLVFTDDQHDAAIAELTARQQQEWLNCTPLNTFYQDQSLADLSTSGLDDDALAAGISAVLNEPLRADKLLGHDFTAQTLTAEQQQAIGLMLDLVGTSYLEHVPCYRGG